MIDPKSLTAEERLIWDTLAVQEFPNSGARHAYGNTRGSMECLILARRALFGEQEKEEAVATKKHLDCGCVLCTCEDETQCHGCGAKCCDAHRQQQRPATPPAPVAKCPVCKNEPGSRPLTGDCYCEAAPVASELPEAVYIAVNTLRADHHPTLAGRLESWARSLPATKPRSYGELMNILYSLCTNAISIGKAQKVLMQWGNGEDVEDYAEADADKVHAFMFGEDERSITATQLPKVRSALDLLQMRTCNTTDVAVLNAALAELNAIPKREAVPVEATIPVGTWQLEELLKYADLAEVALRTGFHPPEFLFTPADRSLRQCIDAIKEQRDQWRTDSAQPAPAPVRMTREFRMVEDAAAARGLWHLDNGQRQQFNEIADAIAAVRAQAEQAQPVKLPETREIISLLLWKIENGQGDRPVSLWTGPLRTALAELDAAEGKVTG